LKNFDAKKSKSRFSTNQLDGVDMQLVNAYIDLRFDYSNPNPVDVNGQLVNSLQEIAHLIGNLKTIGFNSISIAVQVPIDLRTGQVNLGSFNTNDNRALPQDLWKIVE
jgi:hypothetical protein